MHSRFADILERITEAPSWYDSNGTPRYGVFSPRACPDIYSDTVVLLQIACQACEKKFLVEMHAGWWGGPFNPKKLHYGDPPIHDCVGDTMNCEDLVVVQAWHRVDEWERHVELEGEIT